MEKRRRERRVCLMANEVHHQKMSTFQHGLAGGEEGINLYRQLSRRLQQRVRSQLNS